MSWIHRFININTSEKRNPIKEGFWANPIFDDENIMELYKRFLIRAGHCPLCNDFLFIDIDKVNTDRYYVVKRCISHKCDYRLDISREFNENLGFKYPENNDYKNHNVFKNPPSHYYSINIGFDDENKVYRELSRNAHGLIDKKYPNTTGLLDYSLPYRIEVRDGLPLISDIINDKKLMRSLFLIKNVKGAYDVFIPISEKEGYVWKKIANDFDEEELNFEKKYDYNSRSYGYLKSSCSSRKVWK